MTARQSLIVAAATAALSMVVFPTFAKEANPLSKENIQAALDSAY